ncbi:phosphoglycolate phosphatase, partial [Balneatrix alpica]|uniref:Phosphoglycolate phosphatase n=1 Tax=Balneatrix alpica TaxID=75684 RepID=A0ABV5ZFA7_9GAMM
MSQLLRTLFAGDLPRAILFDLDGTLIDSVPDLAWAVQQMQAGLGMPPASEEQVRAWVGNGAAVLVARALTGQQAITAEAVDAALFSRAMAAFRQAYAATGASRSRLYPGVMAALQRARQQGVALGLVTNKPLEFTLPILAHFALSDTFAVVLGGECLPERKPHPLPLLVACQRLEVEPQQALMVGDSRHDVAAAKAAGIKVVALPYGYNHGEPIELSQPDKVVARLDALL